MSVLQRVYGMDYESEVEALGAAWAALRDRLGVALADCDVLKVEHLLGEMRELNRHVSLAATPRYLASLDSHEDRPVEAGRSRSEGTADFGSREA